ncbi:MAG: hypothetical protein IPL78_26240 [Chloroflexi bacterium]|nr:hypothetical protein [Chloroflexota bacterium]
MVERTGERTAAATLYWRTSNPINQVLYVYTRWANGSYTGTPIPATGQHPANNYYPTVAWDVGEIVADFHDLPLPVLSQPQSLALQVTLAPPFSDPATLEWHTLANLFVTPPNPLPQATPLRLGLGDNWLTGMVMPERARPQTDLPIIISGSSQTNPALLFTLQAVDAAAAPVASTITNGPLWQPQLSTNLPPGVYHLLAQPTCSDPAQCERVYCGWLTRPRTTCHLGTIEITGVPLPEGATNYNDLIALLNLDVPETTLQPGGNLTINLQWQALAPITDNYTVFVQVLDANDQIVGQVDSWPVQGTFPTGQWQPGQIINDSTTILLKSDLAPGSYRLIVGWYLLATLQRLPVLNAEGTPISDSLTMPGLAVP